MYYLVTDNETVASGDVTSSAVKINSLAPIKCVFSLPKGSTYATALTSNFLVEILSPVYNKATLKQTGTGLSSIVLNQTADSSPTINEYYGESIITNGIAIKVTSDSFSGILSTPVVVASSTLSKGSVSFDIYPTVVGLGFWQVKLFYVGSTSTDVHHKYLSELSFFVQERPSVVNAVVIER